MADEQGTKHQSWAVRFYWKTGPGPHGNLHEAGGHISFEADVSVVDVIKGVAQQRHVDLDLVHSVEAEHIGEPWWKP